MEYVLSSFREIYREKGGVWFGAAVTKLQMSGVVAECCLVGRIWYGRDVGDGVWVRKKQGRNGCGLFC